MIILKESVSLIVPLEVLYDWLSQLDINFVKWSPYHQSFIKETKGFNMGDKIRFKEQVMGVTYDISGIIQYHEKNENGFKVVFKTLSGFAHIHFIGEKTKEGCLFTHIEEFGKPNTFIGKIENWFLFKVLARKKANWELVKEDMKIDNHYLKQILETGIYPH